MNLARSEKTFTYGTHRCRPPEETLDIVRRHFTAFGITRIADLTGLDSIGIPVCAAVRPNAKTLSVSQGKGPALEHARTSAAMESIELFHAENRNREPVESPRSALPSTSYEFPELMVDSSAYHENLALKWTVGYDLAKGIVVFVPHALVYYDGFATNDHPELFFFTSTGLASGNSLSEAVSHAICEVVERDSTYHWSTLGPEKAAASGRYINLETVDDPIIVGLLEKIKAAGILIYAWSQPTETGIPAFGCALADADSSKTLNLRGAIFGHGCHLSKSVALIRAITEAAQSRVTLISGARDDLYRSGYDLIHDRHYREGWEAHFSEVPSRLDFRDFPSLETARLDDDVRKQLDLLRKSGYDRVVVVDLSRPKFDIFVVRVLIPGMINPYVEARRE